MSETELLSKKNRTISSLRHWLKRVVHMGPTPSKALSSYGAPESEPMQSRVYHCTHCGQTIQASPKAFSVNCRHCNQRVSLEDYRIDAHHAITNIETSGRVSVLPEGYVRAQIRVENLDVQGQLHGNVSAAGKVSIDENAQLIGNVSAQKLEVKSGAVLRGYFTIGQPPPK